MNRRVVLERARSVRLEEARAPEPRPDELLVEVSLAGVCGTDLAIWSGAYAVPLPLVLGHEYVGRVVGRGEGVAPEWEGARVVVEINNHCLARGNGAPCPACRAGLETHCQTRSVTGIVAEDGAFQERLVVPLANARRVPESITDDQAVFVEPLAAALQTFERTPLSPGERIVVLGLGRLGSLLALVAAHLGAELLLVSRPGPRLEAWREAGFAVEGWDLDTREAPSDPLAAAPSAAREAVLAWSGGLGADRVVEACGHPSGLDGAMDLVRPRGTLCLKTTTGQTGQEVAVTRAVVDELRLDGSRCGAFSPALAHLERHPLPIERLVAARYPLEETGAALEHAEQAAGKVLITYPG